MKSYCFCALIFCAFVVSNSLAERFYLMTGVDELHYPSVARQVGGVDFYDGDRLAGTSDMGPVVTYNGVDPQLLMYEPNEFGSLSMLYRRGTIPFVPAYPVPLMAIEFLGGPLLDLDGDLTNGTRSLIPITDVSPVEIPDSNSFVELAFDFDLGIIELIDVDALGTNEGGDSQPPTYATVLVNISGTTADAQKGSAINPTFDTRTGDLTAFVGNSGTLSGVYRIEDLGFELWEDSIDSGSSTWQDLGSMQYIGKFNGWLVKRDSVTGQFPTLSGEGLGSTAWPAVDSANVGQVVNAATGTIPTVTILTGVGTDDYTAAGNGGLALADYSGDIGGYFDGVVVPNLPADADGFVYMESAGFGLNNGNDPVFGDSVGYDVVIVAASIDPCAGTLIGDANCDGIIDVFDIEPFILALVNPTTWSATYSCNLMCANDINRDDIIDVFDIDPFVQVLVGD